MESSFSAEFFTANRRRLREQCTDTDLIVFTANSQLQRNSDNPFPFRQDSNFWYLTGIDEPDLVLVMDKKKEYLIVPTRLAVIELFDGAHDYEQFSQISGIKEIVKSSTGWRRLNARIKQSKSLATLMPVDKQIARYGMTANPARTQLVRHIKKLKPRIKIFDIRRQMMNLRIIKQKPELDSINKAIQITATTLQQISQNHFTEFEYEFEVEASLTAGYRKQGATGHAFTPIVANGKNACQIHYLANRAKLDRNDLLLIDTGAEVNNYAADITRTFSLDEPNQRQREVFDAVLAVTDFGIDQMKPGISFKEWDVAVRKFMGEKLMELGLIKDTETESINKYYPHYSHFLGLDVHDTGDYERPLEPGMVVTVEPGIYIPEERIGVRIEEDILITKSGSENLSASLSRSLD